MTTSIRNFIKNNTITVFIIVVLIPILIIIIFPGWKKYEWQAETDSITIPFSIDNNGHMYIKAEVGDTSGLLFIDTGSDPTVIKESLLDKTDTTYRYKLTDAQNITERKKLVAAQNLKIAEISFPLLHVWPTDNETWSKNGALANKDSVIGILGNTILSNFVWDFNMKDKNITIYRPNDFNETFADSLSIPLIKKGSSYYVEIEFDGKKRLATLDSGCSTTLSLKDTIADSNKSLYGTRYGKNKTFFSHLKTKTGKQDSSFFCIIDTLNIGEKGYNYLYCTEKSKNNLLGIPFFWSYERVVIDYSNLKLYFIKPSRKYLDHNLAGNLLNILLRTQLPKSKKYSIGFATYLDINLKKKTCVKTIDSTLIHSDFRFYGNISFYGNNINNVDSIMSLDSVRLPNGQIKYDNYTIDLKNEYFIDQ